MVSVSPSNGNKISPVLTRVSVQQVIKKNYFHAPTGYQMVRPLTRVSEQQVTIFVVQHERIQTTRRSDNYTKQLIDLA